ncbi:metallophosphoesterase [Herbaspirillum huttiense]|uniref:metallophosphoesterase family protein n=1 Tax=Herbaspirillum huttiense TaxID=863372 RepID=UPI002E79DA25|nr:metallophosphoesterase [Herbaspirillum huttiense]MEE1636928.1 metallophosphoesterase [Herbaspirillum huttiense NC40101]
MTDNVDQSSHRLRIAVITDLHYSCDHGAAPNRFVPQCAIGQEIDPMASLIAMVNKEQLTADLLLCPGDIADRANHEAFKHGWSELKKLRDSLGASRLIAATGNHEVNSRPSKPEKTFTESVTSTLDPVGLLQEIDDYPTDFSDAPERRWIYWGKGYEIIETDDLCLVVINSCHFHVTMTESEYERGKIGSVALTCLRKELDALDLDQRKFRIVLLHHHPIPHEDLNLELGQIEMFAGTKLIEVFEKTYNDWLIIHGHKHLPRLITAQGASSSPVVFAAGSFGAALGALTLKTKNQFYIIELEASVNAVKRYQQRGRVEAFYWASDDWRASTERAHGLPFGCGFDRNINLSVLGNQVFETVKRLANNGQLYVKWSELRDQLKSLDYLMPSHIENLRRDLSKLGVNFEQDDRNWFPTDLS